MQSDLNTINNFLDVSEFTLINNFESPIPNYTPQHQTHNKKVPPS
jgi:hypothetical protein